MPASDEFDLPSLVVELPDDDHGFPRDLVMNFIPLPEAGEFTDFLQFYIELPYDLSGIEKNELLATIDDLNRQLPLGHCVTIKPRPDLKYPNSIGVRYICAFSNEREIDDGCLLEMLMLFMFSCDAVELRFLGVVN
jgi:hypothetical protein